jgi:hypothetical protein
MRSELRLVRVSKLQCIAISFVLDELGNLSVVCVKTLERAPISLFPVVWNTNVVLCRIKCIFNGYE